MHLEESERLTHIRVTAGRTPRATLLLAAVVTVVYLFRVLDGEAAWTYLSARWVLLYEQPWRIVSSPFLHHDLPHVFFNLVFLYLFGRNIERPHGSRLFLLIFFGGLVVAHFTSITLAHDWIVGISGGVCALFGFSIIGNRRMPWWSTLIASPLHLVYVLFLVTPLIPFFAGMIGYRVAHINHLGGILYGLVFAAAFLLSPKSGWLRLALIVFPLLLVAGLFYSPWQDEWCFVNIDPVLATDNADCRVASAVQESYIPSSITFSNKTRRPVGLYWLDYDGNATFYSRVAPGKESEWNTFVGNVWCIVAADSHEALQTAIVTGPVQHVVIR